AASRSKCYSLPSALGSSYRTRSPASACRFPSTRGPHRLADQHACRFRRPYVDYILHGTNPADVPVEEPARFYLAGNLKTTKALGLTVPPALLGGQTLLRLLRAACGTRRASSALQLNCLLSGVQRLPWGERIHCSTKFQRARIGKRAGLAQRYYREAGW